MNGPGTQLPRILIDLRLHQAMQKQHRLLIGGAVNVKQITEHWDELLRLSASLRLGTVTASLMLRKLASYPRQNGLAWSLMSWMCTCQSISKVSLHCPQV